MFHRLRVNRRPCTKLYSPFNASLKKIPTFTIVVLLRQLHFSLGLSKISVYRADKEVIKQINHKVPEYKKLMTKQRVTCQ